MLQSKHKPLQLRAIIYPPNYTVSHPSVGQLFMCSQRRYYGCLFPAFYLLSFHVYFYFWLSFCLSFIIADLPIHMLVFYFIPVLNSLLVIDFLFSLRILSSLKPWREFKINTSACSRVLKKSSNEQRTEKVMEFELPSGMQIDSITCWSVQNNINVAVHIWSSSINCLLLHAHLLTYSIEQSPSESNRFSASKKIPVFYRTRRFIAAFTCAYPEPDRTSPCPIPLPEDPS